MKTNKKRIGWRYGLAVVVILSGLVLNYYGLGNDFLGFTSVGSWLVYIGFVMLAVITLQLVSNRKRVVDERAEFVASKAARITYVAIILMAFVIMIVDAIKAITLPYSLFMSYLICGIILVYFAAYKILEKRN